LVLLVAVLVFSTVGGVASAGENLSDNNFAPVAEKTYEAGKELKGRGTLWAQGNGFMHLRGKGIFKVSGNGVLAVKDVAGDAKILVTGKGRSRRVDGWIFYYGFDGNAKIEGSHVRALISGVNLQVRAQGAGIVKLMGEGHYKAWSSPRVLQSNPVENELEPTESFEGYVLEQ